jgi:hypothetical protein
VVRSSAAVIAAALVAVAAGCGGDSNGIDRSAADRLARQSEAVAASLDRGDGCAAARQARALRSQTSAAIVQGAVPDRLRRQLQTAVTSLERRIVCRPPAVAPLPPPPPQGQDEGDGDGRHEGKGKGKGHKKGKD